MLNRQILLVDDEAAVVAALGRILRQAGITYLSAQSGKEALELMQQHQVSVVISDYKMPGMTGTELLAKIEAQFPATTRIILSGESDFKTVRHSMHSGVVHKFLAKPWINKELLEHIQGALQAQSDRHISVDANRETTAGNKQSDVDVAHGATFSAREEKLNVALDTAIDGMISINSQGVMLSVNPAVEAAFGHASVELLGSNISMLLPEPYRSEYDHYLAGHEGRTIEGGVGHHRRAIGLRKNGEVFPIEFSVNRMPVDKEIQLFVMVRDISQRVSAKENTGY
jgi:PAS domain S-box-containing protein